MWSVLPHESLISLYLPEPLARRSLRAHNAISRALSSSKPHRP